ncbi:MAG: transcriptional regulator GcvA [Salinarimonas sp.]
MKRIHAPTAVSTDGRVLPPLKALRAFEAAARNDSFARAAAELNVTPSAISHQIRQLEAWLGVALFESGPPPRTLTADGAAYHAEIGTLFDAVARATATLHRKGAGADMLTIATMQSFASRWLLPRLGDLRAHHPDLDVRIVTQDAFVDLGRGRVDIAIRYGDGGWPGLCSEVLFEDRVVAVCAPALAQAAAPSGGPVDLARLTLLHDAGGPGWRAALEAAGDAARRTDPDRGLAFSHSDLAIQAALAGEGVALASLPLVLDALADGRLRRLLDIVLPGPGAYYIAYRAEALARPCVATFRAWLRRAGAPTAETA